MNYRHVIFDLDGTLANPEKGIVNSVLYALNKMNIQEKDPGSLSSFIGPPLQKGFQERYNLNNDEVNMAVEFFREYFGRKGVYENYLYPGVASMLKMLKEHDRFIYLATSKLTKFVHIILDHFSISNLFIDIEGADYGGNHAEKETLIRTLLIRNQITDLREVVMIGDRDFDIIGGDRNNIASIGVTYGFGSEKELKNAGASIITKSVKELSGILFS